MEKEVVNHHGDVAFLGPAVGLRVVVVVNIDE